LIESNSSYALQDHQEGIDYTLLTTIHARLTQLRTIVFNTPFQQFVATFARCTFPRLERFVSGIPVSADVVEFLGRHPMIQWLELTPFKFVNQSILTEYQALPKFPSINLPHLTRFVGPAFIVPSIFPTSSYVEKVVLCWDEPFSHDSDIIPVVDSLSRMEHPLIDIGCLRHDWGTQLVDLISYHMQDMVAMSIFNLDAEAWRNWEEEKVCIYKASQVYIYILLTFTPQIALELMGNSLSRFNALQYIEIGCVGSRNRKATFRDIKHGEKVVLAWGAECSSLRECVLPCESISYALLSRYQQYVSGPGADFRHSHLI
jgi:hypothetical protein